MMRQTLDEYLDGALDAQARAQVERTLAADPAAAALFAELKAQRALRASVYNSYLPSSAEASVLASQVMEACADEAVAPIARIGGSWLRRTLGIAAGLAVLIGAFAAGRYTGAAPTSDGPTERVMVAILDPNDETVIREAQEFASYEEGKNFMQNFIQRQSSRTMYASADNYIIGESGYR